MDGKGRIRLLSMVWFAGMFLLAAAMAQSDAALDVAHNPRYAVPSLNDDEQRWLRVHRHIRVGIMTDWPPISYRGTRGEPAGISAGVASALNWRLAGQLVWVQGEWDQLLAALARGELDALMDFTPTPERGDRFLSTSPYLNIPHVLVVRRQRRDIAHERHLRGKTVALEQGFGNVEYFRNLFPTTQVLETDSTGAALAAMASGAADAYVGNRLVAEYLLRPSLRIAGTVQKPGSVLGIGVRGDWPLLRNVLQKTLDEVTPAEVPPLVVRL